MLAGCAKQTGLTGGPRDVTPPQALSYNPRLFSTEFRGFSVEIEFDEFFRVDNLVDNLVVSPPLDYPVNYRIRGKKLRLSWQDTLDAHTTYQFNFGGAIVDLTEKNPTTDLVYVVSTGTFIDSMSVMGTVLRANDNQPLEGAAVMLYRGSADSLPLTVKPDYFANSDAEGNFKVRYLPAGEFKIFALKEENTNYLYDGPPETIGFLDARVVAVASADSIVSMADSLATSHFVPAFVERDTALYVASASGTDFGSYQVVFSKEVLDANIQFETADTEEPAEAITLLSSGGDTLRAWVSLPDDPDDPVDEMRVVVSAQGGELSDTSFWYLETDPKFRDKSELKISTNTAENKLDRSRKLTLRFSNPIAQVDTSLIHLLRDSVPVPFELVRADKIGRVFSLAELPIPDREYTLTLDAGAFRDVFGTYSDSIRFGFSLREHEYYGSLTLSINDSLIRAEARPVVQLIGPSESPVRTDTLGKNLKLVYTLLPPGKYGFNIIFDRNHNGVWDTGNYRLKRQPEKTTRYREDIEVRSNWDLDIEWAPAPPY